MEGIEEGDENILNERYSFDSEASSKISSENEEILK